MKREIIRIDEERCTGCSLCVPNCPEGAIQIIDGKARLISDLFCDGLGACLGHCPEGAITIEEREAEPYDEYRVMENVVQHGEGTITAHLEHLKEHGQMVYYNQAIDYLKRNNFEVPVQGEELTPTHAHSGCPGSRSMAFSRDETLEESLGGKRPSRLAQWPIQLHLIAPFAPYFQGAALLLAADCTAFALGDFHEDHLKGKRLTIACPKLDSGQEIYEEKIRALIDEAGIRSLTVAIMEVPCCGGLLRLAQNARDRATRQIEIKVVVVGIQGEIVREMAA
jgi:ferredoxin